jgi:uncharacterized membrane protein
MLDHIHCPQKGMAQASEMGWPLENGYLPYLLLLLSFPILCSVPVILLQMLLRRLT